MIVELEVKVRKLLAQLESEYQTTQTFHSLYGQGVKEACSGVIAALKTLLQEEPLDNDQLISRLLDNARDDLRDAEDILRVNREQVCIESAWDENPGKPIVCPDLDDALVLTRAAYDLTALAAKKWHHP